MHLEEYSALNTNLKLYESSLLGRALGQEERKG